MIPKLHEEFFQVDMEEGWQTPPGYPASVQQKTLSGSLDEAAKTGSRTRLIRFGPGTIIPKPVVHDHWEEVFIVSGDLVVGCDEKGAGGESFSAYTYAVRPGGVPHGPFTTRGGCLMFELHYYE